MHLSDQKIRKRITVILVFSLISVFLCAAFSGCTAEKQETITSFDQLAKPGTKIGVMFDLIEYENHTYVQKHKMDEVMRSEIAKWLTPEEKEEFYAADL